MEAGLMKRIMLSGSGIFYKIYIYFAPNCPGRIVAPNCPRRIVLRRIVRAELSCAELSGNWKLLFLVPVIEKNWIRLYTEAKLFLPAYSFCFD